MTSNYSTLQSNVLQGLEIEEGQAAFLWACDRPNADRYQYKAEAFAHEVEQILEFVGPQLIPPPPLPPYSFL